MASLATFLVTLLSSSFWTPIALQHQGMSFEYHAPKPEHREVRALYLTSSTAGSQERRSGLVNLLDSTELNAFVIDVKDSTGRVFFDTGNELAQSTNAVTDRLGDIENLLEDIHNRDGYAIARIVVFQDPHLAQARPDLALIATTGQLWRDYKGLSWVDATNREVWKYNLDLAHEASLLGFDEINFDYIRFPSDGPVSTIPYTKQEKNQHIAEFYKYVDQRMQAIPSLSSADLFGMVLWRTDGLNIGQQLASAMPYFDYIAPMVYPSHYPDGFEGLSNPAEYPYEIIYSSLKNAEKFDMPKNARALMRPWLQDFDIGAVYDAGKIQAQKKAVSDANGAGWMLWNASNNYTVSGLDKK